MALVVLATPANSGAQPNVIHVMTDDMTVAQLPFLPHVQDLIERGTRFDDHHAVLPLCCPSRTTFLTGQYPHNHGVMTNEKATGGGYWNAPRRGLGSWLQDAGYRTAWIGKYLNGYGNGGPARPPGWNRWFVTTNSLRAYDYPVDVNGHERRFRQYVTDRLGRQAKRFIRTSRRPFFLSLAPAAPHRRLRPAPEFKGMFAEEALPGTPEALSDPLVGKPDWVRRAARQLDSARLVREWRAGLESLQSVDAMLAGIERVLAEKKMLENTVIFFTSDNGQQFGEHSLDGKAKPYSESLLQPLVIAGPGFEPGTVRTDLTANVDVTGTILDLADALPRRTQDGYSLLGPHRRSELLLEAPRGGTVREQVPAWWALRQDDWFYTTYTTGEDELYDLAADRAQLHNLADEPEHALRTAAMRAALDEVRDCAGVLCP